MMDTTNIILVDSVFTEAANQTSAAAKDPNPYAIAVLGLAGVFVFVLLFMAIVKMAACIDKKRRNRKIEQENN
ncbi:MAG: hypothetical protein LBH82_04525 [Bacteroidales bacterium]|jgi:hypothetical protein|nr:hypothetical protein [Bacteroidales bacterium]